VSPLLRTLIRKETSELSRDRRVLLLGILLPILLYPAMMGGMSYLDEKSESETAARTFPIAVTGDQSEVLDAFRAAEGLSVVEDVPADSLRAAVESGRIELWVDASQGWWDEGDSDLPKLRLLSKNSRDNSREAKDRAHDVLRKVKRTERERRYEERTEGGQLDAVLGHGSVDVSSESESAGAGASRMLVYFLLVSIFMGGSAFATDMIAGEKERQTLETLFLIPADRDMVARAKLIVVSVGTTLTGLLSLASLAVTYRMGWIQSSNGPSAISPAALGQMAILVVPLALLIGTILLAISAYARSLKEAQYYVLPVLFALLIPAVLSMSQAIQLNMLMAVVPIANVAFAMRDAMLGNSDVFRLIIVATSTLFWTGLVLRFVSGSLRDEGTVLGFDPEPVFAKSPSGRGRALHLSMLLVVLAHFYIGNLLQSEYGIAGLAISLWLLPVYAIGVARFAANGGRLTDIFSWRLPHPAAWLAALLLAVGMWLPMAGALAPFQARFLPMPTDGHAAIEAMLGAQATWKLFSVVALSPGIAEELLFRGACLGLLLRLGSVKRAILLSSLYFALIHLDVFRLAPTFLLGVALAILVVRSRSIFVAMLFHVIYNGGLLLGGRYAETNDFPFDPQGVLAWSLSLAALAGAVLVLRSLRKAEPDQVEI